MICKVITLFFLVVLFAPVSVIGGKVKVQLPAELSGNLRGADYLISVPSNWNGTLIVYAHAYGEGLYLPLAEELLPRGYALASSSFRDSGVGWAVQEGIGDSAALTRLFRRKIGRPDRVIIWGASMGGLIAVASIEKYPGIYDGGISNCGTIAGAPEWWDQTLAFAVAYDVAFGWPPAWGYPGDVRDDLDFWVEVAPTTPWSPPADPDSFARWEFVRLMSDLSPEAFWGQSPWGFPWFFLRMWQATGMRAEGEVRAGGPVAENFDHDYDLSDTDKATLVGLGIDPEALLVQMNLRRNIVAYRPARNYMKHWYSPKGNINRPVMTLHTTIDPGTPASHVGYYREQVERMGRLDHLVQVYTGDTLGHCTFTPKQYLQVVLSMDEWLETGERPEQFDFPEALGFVHGFEPPEWPY